MNLLVIYCTGFILFNLIMIGFESEVRVFNIMFEFKFEYITPNIH